LRASGLLGKVAYDAGAYTRNQRNHKGASTTVDPGIALEQLTLSLDLSDTLVVGISATALFDLAEADQLFRERYSQDPDTAIEAYRMHMLAHSAGK